MMAARSRELRVVISGDAKGLNRAFGEVDKGAGNAEKRVHGFGAKVSSAFKVAGAALAGAEIVSQLKDTVTAAEHAQVAQAKLATQLKAVGISYKGHASEITEVIEKTSNLSGITGVELEGALTSVVRGTGSLKDGLKGVAIAADLARAKHMDVAKAGDLVAKVYNGNVGALKRMGISLTPVTTAQDKLKESTKHATVEQTRAAKEADKTATAQKALALLQKRVGGQAEAYGKTAAGAQDRFRAAVEHLRETIGAKLLPVMAKVASAMTNAISWSEKHRTATKALAGAVAALVAGFAAFSVISKVVAAFKAVRGAMIAVNIAMAANPIGAVVIAIAALAAGLVIAYKKSQTFRNIVNGAFNGVKKGVSAAIDFIVSAAKSGFALFKKLAHDGLLGPIPLILSRWGQVKNFFSDLPHGLAGVFNGVVDILRRGVNAVIDVINTAISAYNKLPLAPNIGKIPHIAAPDSRPSTGAVKLAKHATGGIVAGTGRGDTVPALLEPGEFVIRRKVVDQVGAGFLSQLNQGGTSTGGRFASGGPVAHAASASSVARWSALAAAAGAKWNIPPNVLLGLIDVESGGVEGLTSGAGARGLTQFMPGTASQYGVNVAPGHASSQIYGAAHYLHDLGYAADPTRALASYNAGPGNWQAGVGYAHNVLARANQYRGSAAPAAPSGGSHIVTAPKHASTLLGAVLGRAPAHRVGHTAATGDKGFTQTNEPGTPTQGQQDIQRKFQIGVRLQRIAALLKTAKGGQRAQLLAERGALTTELAGIGKTDAPTGLDAIPGANAYLSSLNRQGAEAALTPDTADDADVARRTLAARQAIYDYEKSHGGFSDDDIAQAATDLKSAKDAVDQGDTSQQPLIDALNAVKDELAKQNDFAKQVTSVSLGQAWRAIADMVSGQITGVGYDGRAATAGAGALTRY
jgi:hypothetical protein